ncbi:hypothetical protein [Absidia glauca]|uniref:Uncharacterized protein n=1 Tax=Absidia glauca TaxID=4829 RepID=A0A163JPY7_ABSGL|nr:hypothetical protein [Absidia glauca]
MATDIGSIAPELDGHVVRLWLISRNYVLGALTFSIVDSVANALFTSSLPFYTTIKTVGAAVLPFPSSLPSL